MYGPRCREIRIDHDLSGGPQPVLAGLRRLDLFEMGRQGEPAPALFALADDRDAASPIGLDHDSVELNLLHRGAAGIQVGHANEQGLADEVGGKFLVPRRRWGFGWKIGRASCRERVEVSGGGGTVKKRIV